MPLSRCADDQLESSVELHLPHEGPALTGGTSLHGRQSNETAAVSCTACLAMSLRSGAS